MKKKTKIDMGIALFLLAIAIILLLLPLWKVTEMKWVFSSVLFGIALLKGIQFLCTKEEKDYESLLSGIVCLVASILGFVFHVYDTPLKLAIALLVWVTCMSLIKLKKADYYHDRKNVMWKFSMLELALYMTSAILTSINLYYSPNIELLVLGFFFFIYGLLELIDPAVQMIIKKETALYEKRK